MSENKNSKSGFKPYHVRSYSQNEQLNRSIEYLNLMDERRSVREFSNQKISDKVIENIIKTASTAPSGAHKQPWHFAIVIDPTLKNKIRIAAEKEEYENYHGRMSEEWLEDLEKFDTDWHKPFLEIAPALIVVFKKTYDFNEEGDRSKNYYVNESVGIACGFLLSAIHNAGLAALTHTPSPMNFLQELLERPVNEKAFLLIPIGYPADQAEVPLLERKTLERISTFYK